MRLCFIPTLLLGLNVVAGCASSSPPWYPVRPHVSRTGAYEWFLVAGGSGSGAGRESSCTNAAEAARQELMGMLLEQGAADPDVVAMGGGPGRVERALRTFGRVALRTAARTREHYEDEARRCFVELRWRRPNHLASAVGRELEAAASENEVARAMERALGARPNRPVQRGRLASPTPSSAVESSYPGWFVRLVEVPDCSTHRLAFVGSPRGREARWLELKEIEGGWIVVGDSLAADRGWPLPPTSSVLCD